MDAPIDPAAPGANAAAGPDAAAAANANAAAAANANANAGANANAPVAANANANAGANANAPVAANANANANAPVAANANAAAGANANAAVAANDNAAPASFSKMAADAFKASKQFLLHDFLSKETITTKDYEKKDREKSNEELQKSRATRFEGYQKLCLFGLGSMFWGSVTGVLADIKDKGNTGWLDFCFIYSDIALVFMLIGLAASTFPDSSWLAHPMSGLGALQAFIFVMGSFHIGSLKYHSHIDECINSMIGCAVVITVYWGLSVQDPLILHIVAKFAIWLIGITVYALGFLLCYILYYIYVIIAWAMGMLGYFFSTCWNCLWSGEDSLKNVFMAWYTRPRGYDALSSPVHMPRV